MRSEGMNNFIGRLTVDIMPFVIGEGQVSIQMRVMKDGLIMSKQYIERYDFMKSHFDCIFDSLKREIKIHIEEMYSEP